MALRILVTRPEPEATSTATDLERRGHIALKVPLLEPQFLDPAWPEGRRFDALAATSRNGVRGLVRLAGAERLRGLPFHAVGDATARAARQLGFTDVRSAGGAFADLARLLTTPGAGIGSLLYAAGEERAGDLVGVLAAAGIDVTLLEVYRMDAAERLPEELSASFASGAVDAILVYSERTAAVLVNALGRAGLLETSAIGVSVHAISMKAAAPFVAAGFRSIVVAKAPSAGSLLATLPSEQLGG